MAIETPRANLSSFMHRLQTAYTVYFNRRHHQSGHLMQGRFGASVVDEHGYILKLSRYVHMNPVFVQAYQSKSARERTKILRAYPWSSYHDREDVSFCRIGGTQPADRVMDCICEVLSIERGQLLRRQRNSWHRAMAAKALCDHSGLTQRQAAEALGMTTGVAVSRQLHKLSRVLQGDTGLQKQLEAIRKRVEEIHIKA